MLVAERAESLDSHAVAQEFEACRHATFGHDVAGSRSGKSELRGGGIGQQRTALFCQLCAHVGKMLRCLVGDYRAIRKRVESVFGKRAVKSIGCLIVFAVFVGHVGCKTEFGIAVEAFEKRHSEGVADRHVGGPVACPARVEICMFEEFRALFRGTVEEHVLHAGVLQRVDK